MAFERRAGAERNNGNVAPGADAHDLLHVGGRLRKHHGVRRLVRDPGRGVAVLLAHGLRRDEPVAERGGEIADGGLRRFRIARGAGRQHFTHGHSTSRSSSCFLRSLLAAHDLSRKPVPTFRDHARF